MTDKIAIHVKNLGKQYRLGGPQEKYHTLRDAMVNSLKASMKMFHKAPPEEYFWALKDVSFDVEAGEVVGIIGRNGAGKSTLLKILSRITTPTEGCVDLHGRVGSLLEVGTGFHSELTGRENIYLSGSILGMKRREIDAKLDDIVRFSEIEKFLDTPVKRYSSGMYVRLAFAVAAHLEPEILLVDEVLAVGDAAFQKKCLGKMGDVAKEGRTVLFVSHNMGAINQLCRKSILLNHGHVSSIGPSEEIINKYLTDNSSIKPEITIPYDDNKLGQFVSFRIRNGKGEISSEISCEDVITIEMDFKLREKIAGLAFACYLQTVDGITVFYSNSTDDSNSLINELEIGMHKFSIKLPSRLLAPKLYSLNAGCVSVPNGYLVIDQKDQVCSFEIKDFTTWRGEGRPGFFGLRIPWVINSNN
jgi:lipopolysaccharide transport system ATP-binding protein